MDIPAGEVRAGMYLWAEDEKHHEVVAAKTVNGVSTIVIAGKDVDVELPYTENSTVRVLRSSYCF